MTIICFVIFTGLVFVRRISVFAATHVFADAMILLTIIIIFASGMHKLGD